MSTVLLRLWLSAGLLGALAASSVSKSAVTSPTATAAVDTVFAQYPKDKKEIWPISGYPSYTPVRPLQQSTFAPLREYFSSRQKRNVNHFLQSLTDLINARDQLAKRLNIHEKWWPTSVDLLKINAVLAQDLLTGRTDNPDEISISTPKPVDGKLEVSVREAYTEHGQDRVLGRGHRTSVVTLIPENNRWVIDEIRTRTTDARGEIRAETLSQRLQNAVRPLRDAERAIENLPQKLEVTKGVKADN